MYLLIRLQVVIVFFETIKGSSYNLPSEPNSDNSEEHVLEFLRLGPSNIFWRDLNELYSDIGSSKCRQSLEEVIRSLKKGQNWAYQS